MSILHTIFKPIAGLLGWLLRPVGVLFMLLISIPWFGRGVGWSWGIVLTALNLLIGLIEGAAWVLGLRPEKSLRVGVIILRDEQGQPLDDPDKVLEGIVRAADIFLKQARVRLLPAWPHEKARFGPHDPFERPEGWIKINSEPSPQRLLDVNCKNPALREDLSLAGAEFSFLQASLDPHNTVRRLFGWGAPLTVFMVREIAGFWGCSNGPLNDYVTVVAQRSKCIAHELGHACNLWHSADDHNVMRSRGCGGGEMRWWQVWLLRSSRHVSFF